MTDDGLEKSHSFVEYTYAYITDAPIFPAVLPKQISVLCQTVQCVLRLDQVRDFKVATEVLYERSMKGENRHLRTQLID